MIIFGVILVIGAIILWLNSKTDENDLKVFEANQRIQAAWLSEQNAMKPYKIVVVSKAGVQYESEPFAPKLYDEFGYRRTSLNQALIAIDRIMRLEQYFHAKDHLFIPVCEIEQIRAVQI